MASTRAQREDAVSRINPASASRRKRQYMEFAANGLEPLPLALCNAQAHAPLRAASTPAATRLHLERHDVLPGGHVRSKRRCLRGCGPVDEELGLDWVRRNGHCRRGSALVDEDLGLRGVRRIECQLGCSAFLSRQICLLRTGAGTQGVRHGNCKRAACWAWRGNTRLVLLFSNLCVKEQLVVLWIVFLLARDSKSAWQWAMLVLSCVLRVITVPAPDAILARLLGGMRARRRSTGGAHVQLYTLAVICASRTATLTGVFSPGSSPTVAIILSCWATIVTDVYGRRSQHARCLSAHNLWSCRAWCVLDTRMHWRL
mmetsp:Transcript_55270/g.153145  ORF Transcript_55270/g.153145 Transcript_55270/m.153145 type:complete len:315 (+) Transcript_55270:65-1009(+)